jgi:peptidoglycan biosynthesis protein MviN/MurJ (putative lipid II flippase)
MKIINKLPTPADMVEANTEKLFHSKLSKFLHLLFPLICCVGWVAILGAILFS